MPEFMDVHKGMVGITPVGCSQNSLTTRFRASLAEYPQVRG
jgi:hypothetical protein